MGAEKNFWDRNAGRYDRFMKKDAAEGAAVFAAVQRLALSHPEVSFKFIRDGKQELLTMLCMALNGNIRGLAVALEAIREKKEGEAA